jgi:hypothetical protein
MWTRTLYLWETDMPRFRLLSQVLNYIQRAYSYEQLYEAAHSSLRDLFL